MDYKNDVRIIKALTDENRLAILHMLQDGSKCACVILEELHITQPTLSHHMKSSTIQALSIPASAGSGCIIRCRWKAAGRCAHW